jgi:hypothetical protein
MRTSKASLGFAGVPGGLDEAGRGQDASVGRPKFWRTSTHTAKTGPLCSSDLHKGPARLDVSRIFCRRKLSRVRDAKGRNGPSEFIRTFEILAEHYFFFFFLVVFFAFFAFFAFLAMLPSVVPKKVAFMQVDIDVHAFRVHDDCKIDIAHFKEGKRTPRRRDFRSANLFRDARYDAPYRVRRCKNYLAVERVRPQINLHAAAG